MALTPPIWRQVWVRVCAYVCVYPPFSDFPRFPHSPRFPWPASMSMPTCQSFYENVKVSNSLELRWECLTVHKCPTLDLHKYFARQPENGVGKADGKVGGNREGVGCGVMEHVWWALEKLSKMRKVKQTSAPPLPFYRFQFSISHCWAFSAFHGCHFVSRAVEKFPPRFLLFLTCFSLFFRPVCLFFNIIFFLWVCVVAVLKPLRPKVTQLACAQPLRNPLNSLNGRYPKFRVFRSTDLSGWLLRDRVFRLNFDFQLLLAAKTAVGCSQLRHTELCPFSAPGARLVRFREIPLLGGVFTALFRFLCWRVLAPAKPLLVLYQHNGYVLGGKCLWAAWYVYNIK